jgi:hypothetical protein
MVKEYDVGIAGSLTMIVLFTSVVFLMRSFYKRFMRLQKNSEINQENENEQ